MSMRQSIETRVPLLDHELVENFFNIPIKLKIVNGQQRYLMKQYCKNYHRQRSSVQIRDTAGGDITYESFYPVADQWDVRGI